MIKLKGDIVNTAYMKLRISGITVDPTPEDLEIALDRLEAEAQQLYDKNICIGYNFEDTIDANSLSGLNVGDADAISSMLAFWLSSYFGKQITPVLASEKSGAVSHLFRKAKVQEVQYPTRQPRGSGNHKRGNRFTRYYNQAAQVPPSCDTKHMTIGDIDDFTEDFSTYLRANAEDIASYTIEASAGVDILSDSLVTPYVNYRVEAVGRSEFVNGQVSEVKIVATTTTGRVETRIINIVLNSGDIDD